MPDFNERASWKRWNATSGRVGPLNDITGPQWAVLHRWLETIPKTEMMRVNDRGLEIPATRRLTILDAGCGDGWLVERLLAYGTVLGTDLDEDAISRAQERLPAASFVAGDFMALRLMPEQFDVVTTCEVLSHVADQPAFLAKLASLLKPGGELLLATQNKWTLDRAALPPAGGWRRRWVTRRELRALLTPAFRIREMRTVGPYRGHQGALRLVNSTKLTRFAQQRIGPARVDAIKGALGIGWTIMARAVKR
jgi:2-polyprenyl-3-methyl-5-hydroxy-6-metoxy-1,4-benzoquinol methylase